MKVLHAIASGDPAYGGPVTALRSVCRGLRAVGVETSVLTASSGDARRDAQHSAGFESAFVWRRPLLRRFYWDPFLAGQGGLFRRYTVIHVHGLFNGISSMSCALARRERRPYVLEPFGTLSPACLAQRRWLKTLSLHVREKGDIDRAACVRLSSTFELEEAQKSTVLKHARIIPNGIDWDEIEEADRLERGRFKARCGASPRSKILLFLGRLHPMKGLDLLIRAFLDWKENGDWILVIAGPDTGHYQKQLERGVPPLPGAERIRFTGPLFGPDKLNALIDSDWVVLPSLHENFGLSALEAMACRKPVLVSDRTGIAESVKLTQSGIVFPRSPEALLGALARMASLESQWAEMGRRGRAWAKQECDARVIAGRLKALYEEIA